MENALNIFSYKNNLTVSDTANLYQENSFNDFSNPYTSRSIGQLASSFLNSERIFKQKFSESQNDIVKDINSFNKTEGISFEAQTEVENLNRSTSSAESGDFSGSKKKTFSTETIYNSGNIGQDMIDQALNTAQLMKRSSDQNSRITRWALIKNSKLLVLKYYLETTNQLFNIFNNYREFFSSLYSKLTSQS
jgi:hypothetical protein